jgi:hypothetical protein
MPGKGCLIVRAVVAAEADRAPFDRWYADEHLPDAVKAFGAARGWRGWSTIDPSVHIAVYEFEDAARMHAVLASDALKGLIAEFDRVWGPRVTRTREVLEVAGVEPAS